MQLGEHFLVFCFFFRIIHPTFVIHQNKIIMAYLPVLLGGVAALVMGFIWYHPKVFGTAWMAATGMTEEKAKEANMAKTFGISFVVACILAMYLNSAVDHDPATLTPLMHGALHGSLVGFFVAMPPLLTNGLFEQRNMKGTMINIGYWIVTMAVIGAICGVM